MAVATLPLLVLLILVLGGCQSPGAGRQDRWARDMDEAQRYLDVGLTDSALAAFGLALEENPRLAEAHMGMGHIYRERGELVLASDAFERATVTAPNSFDAHYYLGLMRQKLDDLAGAVRAYLRAVSIEPESYDANSHLATAYLLGSKAGDALPYAQTAVELRGEDPAARANLGATYALLGRHNLAASEYEYARNLGDERPEVVLGLADAWIHIDRLPDALELLTTVNRATPTANTYERQGYAQFKLRRFDDALASYRAALSLEPNDTSSLNGLGVALMTLYIQGGRTQVSQRDAAMNAWGRSLRLNPSQPRIVDLMSKYGKL